MPQYMCQLCANHGQFYQPKKGHKQICPHRDCSCHLCGLNSKRRALDQIERRLRADGNDSGDGAEKPASAGATTPPSGVYENGAEKPKKNFIAASAISTTKHGAQPADLAVEQFQSIDRLLAEN